MPDTMVQTTIRTVDAVPENFITNQLCIGNLDATGSDNDDVRDAIADFFGLISANLFPSTIAQNGHIVKFYDLPGTAPNYPLYESTFNMGTNPSGATLPSEVAVCLSFQGVRTPGSPQARRRGRIYVGPLKTTQVNGGRPASTVFTVLKSAAEALSADILAINASYRWSVWSPTDSNAVPITDGWIDDAWDTQRSRGLARTTRTTFTV